MNELLNSVRLVDGGIALSWLAILIIVLVALMLHSIRITFTRKDKR